MKPKTTQWRLCLSIIAMHVVATASIMAQSYTLTDNDVEVVDGVIESCSYDFAIKDIIIPDMLDGQEVIGIINIDFYANGIRKLTLPSGLISIGSDVFSDNSLTSLDLSNCTSLVSIGNHAFGYNPLTNLDLSGCTALTFIGANAFIGTSLASLDLSGCTTLVSIGSSAFKSNVLTSLNLNGCSALVSIGSAAFKSDALTSFILPSPAYPGFVEWIDGNGSSYAANTEVNDLETTYDVILPTYTLTSDDVVVVDGVITSCSYSFASKSIIIPNTLDEQAVTGIGEGMFLSKGIVELTLPSTLVFIGNTAFGNNLLTSLDLDHCTALASIGHYAFYSNLLTSLNLSDCTALRTIGDYVFSTNSLRSLNISGCSTLATMGPEAFGNNSIMDLDLSGCTALRSIGSFAFYENSLSSIVLSDCSALTSIGDYAFYGNSINSFTLPTPAYDGFIEWIDGNDKSYTANAEVSRLYTSYTAKLPTYTLTSDDVEVTDGVITSCSCNFVSRFIIIPNTLDGQQVTGIADGNDFYLGVFYAKGIRELTLPSTLVSIGKCAFSNNFITSLDFSGYTALTSIGDNAFWSGSLTSVDFSGCTSLISIGSAAFVFNSISSLDLSGCTGLTSISSTAFQSNSIINLDLSDCTALASIGENAFSYNSLASVDLSGCTALTSIGRKVFANNSLASLDLSGCTALTFIDRYAFNDNLLNSFILPTPGYDGFAEWIDGNNKSYAANTEVSDLTISYTALIVNGTNAVHAPVVTLYPNPATSKVTVAGEQGNLIEVYSTSGYKVMSQIATSNAEVLNIEFLQSGTYIVKVGCQWGKLIVE